MLELEVDLCSLYHGLPILILSDYSQSYQCIVLVLQKRSRARVPACRCYVVFPQRIVRDTDWRDLRCSVRPSHYVSLRTFVQL